MSDIGTIFAIIAGSIAIVGLLWGVLSFVKKVNRMDRMLSTLVMIHAHDLADFYKENISYLYNPQLPPSDRDYLIDRLQQGTITDQEAERLEDILKVEKSEAERLKLGVTVAAIVGVLALLYIITKKK